MKSFLIYLPIYFSIIVLLADIQSSRAQTVLVTIDTTATYQPISGWGISLFVEDKARVGDLMQDRMLDLFVNHMGCNAYRWEISRQDYENYNNDNSNPDSIDWDYFKSTACDQRAMEVVIPMKKMVEARGEKFVTYSSTSFFMEGSTGTVPEWMIQSPAELSEWLLAHLWYVKNKYGISIDQICIANEPDNHNRFNATNVGNAVKYLGPKLKKEGFSTKIMFPEHAMVSSALDYIEQWKDDPEVMNYISCFGYHLYFETAFNIAEKQQIYKIAKSKNIPVAQTEAMWIDFGTLYDDLVNGSCSYWYTYWDKDYLTLNNSKTSFSLKQTYWDIRQVLKYVKQGSFRTQANTTNSKDSKVMAFKKNGEVIVVCQNSSIDKELEFAIQNLPAGFYAINKGKTEVGIQKADQSGSLKIKLSAKEIVTIYPTKGQNQPPLVVEWNANPSYMQLPLNSTKLTVVVSDQEKDIISYKWTVKKQPEGTNVTFTNDKEAVTTANGLNLEGEYEFVVTISDKKNTPVQELIPVRVVAVNQAPVIFGLENVHPVYLGLPGSLHTVLKCVAYDPDEDPVNLLWTIESQPAGTNIIFQGSNTRSCEVSNLSVAGDYIFRITADDGKNKSFKDFPIKVHPVNIAPVINSIIATPANISIPTSEVMLSAKVSDANGDHPGCWWKTSSCPPNSKPVFSNQGRMDTKVTGISIPGTYVFNFVAADNLSRVSDEIRVTVK